MAENGAEPIARSMRTETRMWEILQVLMGLLMVITTGMTGWIATTVVSHGERISAIEADRHTSEEALELHKATAKEFLEVWREIADVRGNTNKPPEEVLRWLERVELRLERLEGKQGG